MPGGSQGTASGVLRSSAAIGAALVLAVSAFVAQTPQTVAAAGRGCVTPGNDGPNAALPGFVNSYYPATASATAGAAAISVGTRIPALSPAIAPGDLLLVIQMQDADISGTNAITYGDGATGRGSTGLRSTGLYEYVAATSAVVAGSVTIAGSGAGGGLVNSYDFSTTVTATNGFRTFQVIRVPQYSSATITAGLTAAAWDGAAHAGGVLAIDVAGALNLNTQTISVNQLGFKGGLGVQKGGEPGGTGTDYVVPSSSLFHGYKAEGIAGTPRFLYDAIAAAAVTGAADGYPSGDAARAGPGPPGPPIGIRRVEAREEGLGPRAAVVPAPIQPPTTRTRAAVEGPTEARAAWAATAGIPISPSAASGAPRSRPRQPASSSVAAAARGAATTRPGLPMLPLGALAAGS